MMKQWRNRKIEKPIKRTNKHLLTNNKKINEDMILMDRVNERKANIQWKQLSQKRVQELI